MIESESRVGLPEGLAEMPPGPRLAAALASVDRSLLCGFDLVVLLQARNRQLAFEQAELAADLVAVTANVTPAEPPLVPVLPWPFLAAGSIVFGGLALGIVAFLARRSFRAAAPARPEAA